MLPIDRTKWKLITSVNLNVDELKAPIDEGEILGYVECRNNNETIGKVNLVAYNTVKDIKLSEITTTIKKTIRDKIKNTNTITIIIVISFVLFFIGKLRR